MCVCVCVCVCREKGNVSLIQGNCAIIAVERLTGVPRCAFVRQKNTVYPGGYFPGIRE